MTNIRPVYIALFSLTLVAVIAASGALMVFSGRGRDVMLFALGVGVGLSLVSALSVELWWLLREQLFTMQATIEQVVSALHLGQINPRLWLLSSTGRPMGITPTHVSDMHLEIPLEIECRRLLDRVHQLLEKMVDEDGCCGYCSGLNTHREDCIVPETLALYRAGKAKRVPWQEYQKTLPES